MAAFTEEGVEAILTTCGDNAAALAESLSQCFDQKYRIEVGESGIWSPRESPVAWSAPWRSPAAPGYARTSSGSVGRVS